MATGTKTKNTRAPRNRTLSLEPGEVNAIRQRLAREPPSDTGLHDQVICGDAFSVVKRLPTVSFDMLFADPPYNLTKDFGTEKFKELSSGAYEEWLDSWLRLCVPLLKPNATVYICGDWRSSAAIQRAGSKYFKLRNRITWEREKGRGAKANWKNAAEDIWFFTVSDEYTFNLDAVKIKRKVIAPYTENG
ncbi:MAG TPA: DNA methyltransferase, partial [Pyrinomonadaceae bacterium]|nr:DNA methyltransferase [Pyrinomonadaceae bacterium]